MSKPRKRFRINDRDSGDSVIIEGNTLDEIQKKTRKEVKKRGWKNCWSEKITNQ